VCRVALSEPLLKFRSATEVKETLLHEMIHAWQFVTAGRRDRSDHGPIFLAKMGDINAGSRADMYRPHRGYRISVYHSFRDEVRRGGRREDEVRNEKKKKKIHAKDLSHVVSPLKHARQGITKGARLCLAPRFGRFVAKQCRSMKITDSY
jgi:hypothetical protein